jgi:hypothetical protein
LALKVPQPTAPELAGFCLNHLAENPDQLADFMGITGISPDGLRQAVGTASFARGLIDYVVQNEPLLLAICAANRLQPETVMRVWAKLNPAGD